MKMFVQLTGGPSPGLELLASREDLRSFATELSAVVSKLEADGREEGEVRINGLEAKGDTLEWLSIRAVRDVGPMFATTDAVTTKRFYLYAPIAWAVGLVILYLAYRGVRSML